MEALLSVLLPKLLDQQTTFRLHEMGGKTALLKKLPARLWGYAKWIPNDYIIVIVLDRDNDDCVALKNQIAGAVRASGLVQKKAGANASVGNCAIRIAVEELEAWVFGDCNALRAAYPGVSPTLEYRAPYRNPDAIAGGTWEALERVLKQAGYYAGGMPKVEVANRGRVKNEHTKE
ncbi:MAG: DUF4276 family protein [Fimbriimonadaceae bacterium]